MPERRELHTTTTDQTPPSHGQAMAEPCRYRSASPGRGMTWPGSEDWDGSQRRASALQPRCCFGIKATDPPLVQTSGHQASVNNHQTMKWHSIIQHPWLPRNFDVQTCGKLSRNWAEIVEPPWQPSSSIVNVQQSTCH